MYIGARKIAIHLRWIERSKFIYIYYLNECRGDFRIVAGAGDECLEVLRGVFGFDGALEDVEPTGERDVLAGERAFFEDGDDFFSGERVRFEDDCDDFSKGDVARLL